jgi:hypothetical protein
LSQTSRSDARSLVIDHIEEIFAREQNVGVAYIYFDYKSQESQNVRNIAASLLRQLTAQLPEVDEQLEKSYDDLNCRYKVPETAALLQFLASAAKSFHRCFIVLDALDECSDTQRPQIVSLIKQLSDAPFHIFATSRDHHECVQELSKSTPTIEIQAHDDDIQNFINIKLDEDGKTKQDLRNLILSSLLTKAQGS